MRKGRFGVVMVLAVICLGLGACAWGSREDESKVEDGSSTLETLDGAGTSQNREEESTKEGVLDGIGDEIESGMEDVKDGVEDLTKKDDSEDGQKDSGAKDDNQKESDSQKDSENQEESPK